MVVNARSVTPIMKRRVTADLPDIHTFPSSSSIRAAPFRVRIIEFLRKHAASPPPSSLSPKLMCLQVLLRIGEAEDQMLVGLDVVEEEVARSSRSVYCDPCRVVGELTRSSPESESLDLIVVRSGKYFRGKYRGKLNFGKVS